MRDQLFTQLSENLQTLKRGLFQRSVHTASVIPFGQRAALFSIAIHRSINVKQLAALLGVSSGAATQHIESLVQAGLVERETNPDDRRNVVLRISRTGAAAMKELERERLEFMRTLCAEISDAELETFVVVTKKMKQTLTEMETAHAK